MLLEVTSLNAGYGFLQILRDVSICLDEGEYVCLVGPNGAGKSTTMKSIAGMLKPMSGSIRFASEELAGLPGYKVSRKGIAYVSEGMNLFTQMTVKENLLLGAYLERDKQKIQNRLHSIYELFPRLVERRDQLSGTLSGGERKMLSLGRGLMGSPRLLLVDEPSFGLAPQMTETVFAALDILNKEENLSILLVEQNVTMTLEHSQRGYVMEHGKVTIQGSSQELNNNEHVRKAYLGV
jgi:branched-chain amino acid transport system ATP-binding protein